jgi:hypothetical protein
MSQTNPQRFRERPLLASMRAATPARVAIVLVVLAAILIVLSILGLV